MGPHNQGAPQLLANSGALPWGVMDVLCCTWSLHAACRGVTLRVEVTPVCQLGSHSDFLVSALCVLLGRSRILVLGYKSCSCSTPMWDWDP